MPSRSLAAFLGLTLLAAWAPDAAALQPLETFVQAARNDNPGAREARATAAQRGAEADVATGRLLPTFSAQGIYTNNQYDAIFAFPGTTETFTIEAYNQYDAYFTLAVPLVDVGAWERRASAVAIREAANAGKDATLFELERGVTQAYYQLLGSEALLQASQKSLDIALGNGTLVQNRRDSGTASELDTQRAESDVARARQDLAGADLALVTARRALASLTGVEPEPATEFPEDDLHAESPLAGWMATAGEVPTVKSAAALRHAADKNADSSIAAWFPVLSGQAQEHDTNVGSLVGKDAVWFVQATASWRLDGTLYPAMRAQKAAAAAAHAREDSARRAAEDTIFDTWQRIRAGIERARAARAQVAAATHAAELAADRYTAGVATQLDVLQAQQDAFGATVARIQADADLAYARAALRLYSGRPRSQENP